jgi:predicted DNA-binding protein YlxM (UPF0122 family)
MSERIKRLLEQYASPDSGPKRQVNVRIELDSFLSLEELSERYSVSRSALAGDLLEVAIADAMAYLYSNLPQDEVEGIEAGIRQRVFEQEQEQ